MEKRQGVISELFLFGGWEMSGVLTVDSTWVKPIDQDCLMPAETFILNSWQGTSPKVFKSIHTDSVLGTPGGKC